MTRFFEVTARDGPARIGKLLVRGGLETPYLLSPATGEDLVVNGGNKWLHSPVTGTVEQFTVQPYVGLTPKVNEDLVRLYQPADIASDTPSATLAHPDKVVSGADMYVISGVRSIEGDSRALLHSFIQIRNNSKPDTALYVPALATPENVSLLIYLSADIVDDVLTTIKAYQGLYLTQDGEYPVKDLAELPCTCDACTKMTGGQKSDPELLAAHNRAKLREEISRVKIHIRNGMLREYVEKQCRSKPWLTALLRLADAEYTYLESRTPTYRSSELLACSAESQNRVEVRRFADRLRQRFSSDGKILIIIPCSARKPYSTSQSHMAIINALGKYRRYVREIILTSPMGVVPRELELVYPAAHYDVAVTGVWDLEERHWVSGCLRDFIDNNRFERVIAHVEGPYVEVCAQADREMIFTSTGKVSSDESLRALVDQVKLVVDELAPQPRNFEQYLLDMFRKMADYEFGKGRGDLLVPQKGIVKGKFPRMTLFDGREQLCTINPAYGSLTLTLEGARRMKLTDQYFVEITDFMPRGSILAPGVVNADPQIRPGDDVFIIGKKAIGVGRAKMSGREMVEASRGMAVELKHVEPVK
ncbi:archaeosine synthase subunit alpha [Methanocella arvoryzae]|uniref:Archaeosine tRNA-ribosyltransferase n=1 Tax=Methanocella arvoryzae (strain DSM 22066 / NBRC 105507 / MRE50) TaxID=351160 RepID=Q0W8N3_METAR|nr:archaeosine synthase subunit alpha [Methanocella arvoryzae]CAJ35260.1 archaeosine tRNA-ribosyltransferase [Methanocella arvoryzae MRE50]